MEKKWNLGDIRPAAPREKAPRAVPSEGIAPQKGKNNARKAAEPAAKAPAYEKVYEERTEERAPIPRRRTNASGPKKTLLIGGAIAVILILGVLASTLLGGAVVTVHPKHAAVAVAGTFVASTSPQADEALPYELLTLEATGERQVTASGKEEAKERAEGIITVYNTGESTQRLIKNTRFETESGLIFRVLESVEVPPQSETDGGEVVPGQVDAPVFADATGEEYNVAPTRFTVPGLSGTAQFNTVYGQSKAAMTGGFEGERYIIEPDELRTATDALHEELSLALRARLENEKPAGFVLYTDAITFGFESLPATEYGDSVATIKETARLRVPIFKAEDLASHIAQAKVEGYSNEPVLLSNPEALVFSYTQSSTTPNTLGDTADLSFTLTGSGDIVYTFDEGELQSDLAGSPKAMLPSILGSYPAIERAEATLKPFWSRTFPKKAEEITIRTEAPESAN